MRDWKNTIVAKEISILKVIEVIDQTDYRIAVVTDADGKLLGTVTDGDVRRGLLKGVSVEENVAKVANLEPTYIGQGADKSTMLGIMQEKQILQIPVVDEDHCVVDLVMDEYLEENKVTDHEVVIMAGGLGSRLGKLTKDIPKPLLKVGEKPILETIIEELLKHGIRKIHLTVNYKSEMIVDYFGNGEKWGAEINYIHEEKRMGTAGSLSLLPSKPSSPLIVMNGDLLTKINFKGLLEFHRERKPSATIGLREYEFQVPYGVVKMDHTEVVKIIEKPTQKFFVNAGVYVLNPDLLDLIPKDQYYDITDLFDAVIARNEKISGFPIRELWIDIGQVSDFKRAEFEYKKNFK